MTTKVRIYTDGTTPGLPEAPEAYDLAGKHIMVHDPNAPASELPKLVLTDEFLEGKMTSQQAAIVESLTPERMAAWDLISGFDAVLDGGDASTTSTDYLLTLDGGNAE